MEINKFTYGNYWTKDVAKKVSLAKKGKRTSIKSEFKKGHPFYGTLEGIEKMKVTMLKRATFGDCPQCNNKFRKKSKRQVYCNRKCMSKSFSILLTGRKLSEKTIEKMKNRIISPETRKKISIAHKGLHSKEKHPGWIGGDVNKSWSFRKREIKAGRKMPDNCECCNKNSILVFDHDHKNGKFRGWICSQCNIALGHASDDISKLKLLIKYLKKQR